MTSGKVIDTRIPAATGPLTQAERAKVLYAASQYKIPVVKIDGDIVTMRGLVQLSGPRDLTPLNVRCRGFGQTWWTFMCLSDLERCAAINKKLQAANGFPIPTAGEPVRLTQPVAGCLYGIVAQVADDGTLTVYPVASIPATASTSAKNAQVI